MRIRRRSLLAGAAATATLPMAARAEGKPRVTFISQWSSGSDGAVLPHLYEELGPTFVERLNGIFGIALWDQEDEDDDWQGDVRTNGDAGGPEIMPELAPGPREGQRETVQARADTYDGYRGSLDARRATLARSRRCPVFFSSSWFASRGGRAPWPLPRIAIR